METFTPSPNLRFGYPLTDEEGVETVYALPFLSNANVPTLRAVGKVQEWYKSNPQPETDEDSEEASPEVLEWSTEAAEVIAEAIATATIATAEKRKAISELLVLQPVTWLMQLFQAWSEISGNGEADPKA